jgi:aspartate/methionine/tyrosine aminotransferase
MSAALKGMEYAVRGKVVIAANKINDELRTGSTKYPFDRIVYTNIGNPHSVGLKPLTWPRQVLALVDLPDEVGVDHPQAIHMFPPDAIRRAREIKQGLGGYGSGAYSHSKGVKMLREDVVDFIQRRDGGVPVDVENVYLTNGASDAIKSILTVLIADSSW